LNLLAASSGGLNRRRSCGVFRVTGPILRRLSATLDQAHHRVVLANPPAAALGFADLIVTTATRASGRAAQHA
jgi:hypothetical protein